MIIPKFPENELERRETLRALQILYSHPEERFDRLTRLARNMFDVPIALISLVASDRQWFKSSQGLKVQETPRYLSFCAHAIHNNEAFIVPDALKDPRFFDNPLVTSAPNIRFYAGYPLTVSNGCKLGTLCLIDDRPRTLSVADRLLLKELAHQAELEMIAIQQATLDDLTKMTNYSGLVSLFTSAMDICQRDNRTLSMLITNLTGLSQLTAHCREQGDEALVKFANIIRQCFTDADVFARTTGNEFAILYSNQCTSFIDQKLSDFNRAIDEFNQTKIESYQLQADIGRISLPANAITSVEGLLGLARKTMIGNQQTNEDVAHGYLPNPESFLTLACANDEL